MTARAGELKRTLGVRDAVVVGAGSMIGAGVFAAWSPAADAAGTGLLVGLAIAALVAFCNATSSAQLAAVHPESGGTYVYGRRRLGPFWGHLAGWGFVVGKTASCAAMALTVGAYLWPAHDRAVAIGAVVAITLVNIGGLERTVAVTKVLLAVVVVTLAAVVVSGWSSDAADLARLTPIDASPLGVLRSAGFLFFAFAGYARIATLGEEVRDPSRTIPRAIPLALAMVLGASLCARGFGSRAWCLVTGAAGLFFALFGMLRLGVWLDAGLLVASVATLALAGRRQVQAEAATRDAG